MVSQMQNNTERWLVHEGLRFRYEDSDTDQFKVIITGNADARDAGTEIFEPSKQPGIIVIGRKCPFGTEKNIRYSNMTESERQQIMGRISTYCNTIGAVHRFYTINGRRTVGVYIVLDSSNKINQSYFSDSLGQIVEMYDKVNNYLKRAV